MTGCGEDDSNRFAKEVQALDSLETELMATQQAFDDFDTTGMTAMADHMMYNLRIIQELFKDTMERDLGVMLSQYKGLKKGFKDYQFRYANYEQELAYTIEQVKSLKTDLSNGVVAIHDNHTDQGAHENAMTPDDRARLFYEKEMKAGTKMCSEVTTWLQLVKNVRSVYEETNPKVDAVVEKLKTKNAG